MADSASEDSKSAAHSAASGCNKNADALNEAANESPSDQEERLGNIISTGLSNQESQRALSDDAAQPSREATSKLRKEAGFTNKDSGSQSGTPQQAACVKRGAREVIDLDDIDGSTAKRVKDEDDVHTIDDYELERKIAKRKRLAEEIESEERLAKLKREQHALDEEIEAARARRAWRRGN